MRRALVWTILFTWIIGGLALAEKKPPRKVPTPGQNSVIRSILGHDYLRSAKVSISVVSLKTGRVFFRKNSNQMLIPASTNKILSGAAALDSLGPGYRFVTEVYTTGPLRADGTLEGDLYFKGGGDPSLSLERAWLLAHQVGAHGVRTVNGHLIGDESFFDNMRHYKQWGDVGTRAYHAPMGALSVNFNTLGVFVAPGPHAGDKGNATLEPATSLFQLENRLLTIPSGATRVAITLKNNKCIVSGQIPDGAKGKSYYRSIEEPLPFALSTLRTFLLHEGVTVAKENKAGVVLDQATLLFENRSKPLSLVIRDLYRNSNNFTAEQTARTLGAVRFDAPGTQAKASKAIEDWLKANNLFAIGVVIDDASGLSRNNRTSAKVLVDVLGTMWNKPEVAPEFVDAMAIGGVDGTLKRRFKGTALEGRVRAKSGLLWGVITLAGYCWDSNNEPYAFAVLINEYDKNATVRDIQYLTEKLLNVMMQ